MKTISIIKLAAFVLLAVTCSNGAWVSKSSLPRIKRAASVQYEQGFPKATVYYMDSLPKSSDSIRKCITSAMEQIEQCSCVKFIDAKNRKAPEGLGMLIITRNMKQRKCSSNQGLKRSQSTLVTLGSKCGSQFKTCMRELLHALGFHYEHERPERDKYLKENSSIGKQIMEQTIAKKSEDNFLSLTEYDISSLMHFDPAEFRERKVGVEARDYILQDSMGSGIRGNKNLLSHRDKHALNILFHCSRSCRERAECLHGGFVNRDCQCECPNRFTGRSCESLSMSQHFNVFCGAVENSTEGFITSPKYPNRYPRGLLCQWLIKGAEDYEKIEFKFEKIDLEHDNMIPAERCKDTLRVWPHGTEIVTKYLSCLPEDVAKYTEQMHKTQKNWLLLEFRSDKWGQYNHSGFKLNYRIVDDRPLKDRVVVRGVKDSKALKKLRDTLGNITDLTCYACPSKSECNRTLDSLAKEACKPMQACSKTTNEHSQVEWRGCMPAEKCVEKELRCVSDDSDLSCSSCCIRDYCNDAGKIPAVSAIILACSILSSIVFLIM